VVGVGRAGSCVIAALRAAKAAPRRVLVRDPVRAAAVRAWLADSVAVDAAFGAGWRTLDTIVLAVPDRAIDSAAAALDAAGIGPGAVRLHLSGVQGAALCGPPPHGSCHPLAALPDALASGEAAARAALAGATCALDGDPVGMARAAALAEALGAVGVPVASEGRAHWHAAAAVVANDLVALLAIGERAAVAAGVERGVARAGLLHLARTAIASVEAAGGDPAAGLTGAVARGDANTLRRHLDALPIRDAAVHRTLSRILVDVAEAGGRLDGDAARAVRDVLEDDETP
jgi:predicted short-subunit dehydrogenase-like oxidoreductase (DUF2520 family)